MTKRQQSFISLIF